MKLALYTAPTAYSLVPYLTLTEAGAEFEVQPLNLRRDEHTTAEFRRINPKQAVPVLMIDGQPLTENVAIQIWIARNYPSAALLPTEPLQEIRAISFLAWCASGIHP
jgi:glutathione S-transferase